MYSEELRRVILNMHQNKKKCAEIATLVGISTRAVYSILGYKNKVFKSKRGPKPKINSRLATRLKKYIQSENNNGSKVNCPKIIKNLDITLKRRTLNDWLLKKDYVYKHHAQNIQLSKNDKIKRVSLCKSWLDQNIQWKNSVFTDEKAFSLDGPDNWFV